MNEYRVVYESGSDAIGRLNLVVNRMISDGWSPLGDVSIAHADRMTDLTAAQAMVRPRPERPIQHANAAAHFQRG